MQHDIVSLFVCVYVMCLQPAMGIKVEESPVERAKVEPHLHADDDCKLKAYMRDIHRNSDDNIIRSLNGTFYKYCGLRSDTRMFSGASSMLAIKLGLLTMFASIYAMCATYQQLVI